MFIDYGTGMADFLIYRHPKEGPYVKFPAGVFQYESPRLSSDYHGLRIVLRTDSGFPFLPPAETELSQIEIPLGKLPPKTSAGLWTQNILRALIYWTESDKLEFYNFARASLYDGRTESVIERIGKGLSRFMPEKKEKGKSPHTAPKSNTFWIHPGNANNGEEVSDDPILRALKSEHRDFESCCVVLHLAFGIFEGHLLNRYAHNLGSFRTELRGWLLQTLFGYDCPGILPLIKLLNNVELYQAAQIDIANIPAPGTVEQMQMLTRMITHIVGRYPYATDTMLSTAKGVRGEFSAVMRQIVVERLHTAIPKKEERNSPSGCH